MSRQEPGPCRAPCGSRAAWVFSAAWHLRLAQHPGRRRRRWRRQVEIMGIVGEADRRPDHPAIGLDLLGDDRIAIIGFGEKAAEFLFGIVDEDGEENFALVGGDDRLVVGQHFGARARAERGRGKSRPTIGRDDCDGNCRGGGGPSGPSRRKPRRTGAWGGRKFVASKPQTSRVSKSIRGSIQV